MGTQYLIRQYLAIKYCVPIFLIFLSGCSTEFNPATNRQETLMYDDEKEKAVGASVALQIEKAAKFNNEVDVNERVEKILKRIAAVCDRKDMVYTIRVIEDDVMNAFSLPGGYIYVNKGLLDRITNDDQLAAVIGHEVGHVTAKHAMKRLQGAYGSMALEGLAIASGNTQMASGIGLTADSLLFQNSREDEFQADQLGIKYMAKAGYDPTQMRAMLVKLLEYQSKEPLRPLNYWRTHPYIPQRMAKAGQTANGKAEFKDYLNMTGDEK